MSTRVIITGAASGIGAETVKQLRSRGCQVVGLDLDGSEEDGILACDVRSQEAVDDAVAAALDRLGGGVDVLVNCAGIGIPQSAGARPDESALAVIDVNLLGPWRVTGAALEALREARGRVVNVASGLAFLTVPFATAYCMSKRGIVAYSDALRVEHGDALTVTTVYPGYIKTPIHDASADLGVGLEGAVPEEPLSSAADAMVRAVLGPPVRDLATTSRGTVSYAVLQRLPRRLIDRAVRANMKRMARKGAFDRSPLASDFVGRQRAG